MTVLVLNKAYMPLEVVSDRKAVNMVWAIDKEPDAQPLFGPTLEPKGREKNKDEVVMRGIKYDLFFSDIIVAQTMFMPVRTKVPAPTTRYILLRDNFTCAYCGQRATTVDHIVPTSKGGENKWNNTIGACRQCNQNKGAKSKEQFLDEIGSDELRFLPKTPTINFVLFYRPGKEHWLNYCFI